MKKVCVKVDQRLGEQLRVLLIKQGLLDPDFPITKKGTQLYLPLRSRLSPRELKTLEQKTSQLQQVEVDLEPLAKKPGDLSAVLQDTLPDDLHQWLPHSLDIVGEIAIVELNDLLTPYEAQIGHAIMVVNSRVTTVYAKEGGVEGIRRLRPLRLIAGKNQSNTIHTEYGVKLAIDITHAYFSPRLGTEHDRVTRLIHPNEVIVDMFTGVGPFALLAAKRHKVQVFAIDVNPQAIQCLKQSLSLNRLAGEVVPLVGDTRTIIRNQLAGKADRIIMNLPNDAITYLDAASKALNPKGGVIHFYGVTTKSVSLQDLERNVLEQLTEQGWKVQVLNSRVVRPAAPHENQIVLDLHLSPANTTRAT
jgi:tRNA (guanine37-N1)-methyltransferase